MLGAGARYSAGNYFAALGDKVPHRVVILICYFKISVRAEAADFTFGVKWLLFLGSPFYQLDLLPMTVCSNALNCLVVWLRAIDLLLPFQRFPLLLQELQYLLRLQVRPVRLL